MAVALGYQSRFAWPGGIISLQNEFNEFGELFSPSPILKRKISITFFHAWVRELNSLNSSNS
jgi:hypothetical protein